VAAAGYREFEALAHRLADRAGEIQRRYFRTSVAVDTKADASPVTIADREAEAAMRDLIAAAYPHHGILGEEHGQDRIDAEFVWVLDPIDGTKSFITGRPLFGTLIALAHRGRPVMGMIDQSILRERWIGSHGTSSAWNGRPIRVRACPRLEDAEIIVAGGRGLGSPQNFGLVEQLAEAVGGMPAASRPIVDDGWADSSRQIGLTGKSVRPRLYIAVGVSGASQHMAGCSAAKAIVAINRDADAAIFRHARYGVVGDCLEIVPELIRALRNS
jgi:inositol-phosphate phosphatase/L-galactose 1-phosphate phosphatase/histidinol-phosphatase